MRSKIITPKPARAERANVRDLKPEQEMIRDLALLRYNLRRFLRFSEKAARACGVTPQQHQLMLGIAGFIPGPTATISELAEFLQERNNSVVGLVERAAQSGLVRRQNGATDRRQVVVSLTPRGREILAQLSVLHHQEVQRIRAGFLTRRDSARIAGEKAAQ
jgi:DNA-binding MarR family transcriptional regulator